VRPCHGAYDLIVVRGFGVERFGAPLIWAFLGYFAPFDVGLGRAVSTCRCQLAPGRWTKVLIRWSVAAQYPRLDPQACWSALAVGHAILGAEVLGERRVGAQLRLSLAIVAAAPNRHMTSVLNGVAGTSDLTRLT
jgi:hypothetical protein